MVQILDALFSVAVCIALVSIHFRLNKLEDENKK